MASSKPKKAGQAPLQLPVQVLGAADEAHRGEAVAALVERRARRGEQPRVAGEPEVVVGAEVEDPAAAHLDLRALRRLDDPLLLPGAGGADLLEGCGRRRRGRCSYTAASSGRSELDEDLGVGLDLLLEGDRLPASRRGRWCPCPPCRITFQTCSWMLGEVDSSRLRVMCQVSKMRRPTTAWRLMPSTMTRSRLSMTASPLFRPKRMTWPPRRTTEMAVLSAALEPDISRATSTPTPSVSVVDGPGDPLVVDVGGLGGLGGLDHRVGAELLRHLDVGPHGLDADHLAGAQRPGHGDGEEADGAAADDGHRLAAQVHLGAGVHGVAERLLERRHLRPDLGARRWARAPGPGSFTYSAKQPSTLMPMIRSVAQTWLSPMRHW